MFMEVVESQLNTVLFWSSFHFPEHLSIPRTRTCIFTITVFETFHYCWKVCISSRTDYCEGNGLWWVYQSWFVPVNSSHLSRACFHPHGFLSVIPEQGFPWPLAVPLILLSRNRFPFLPLKSEREWMTATGLPTCRTARSIEGEHSLNGDVHGRDIKGFKHDLKGQCRIRLSGRNSSTFWSKE